MAGKSLISEPKKALPRKAQCVLLFLGIVLAQACFIPPEGRTHPDGGPIEPIYARPPEVVASTPVDPISDFEFAPGTENCLFLISATLLDRDSDELDLRLVTDNQEPYRRRVDSRRIDVADGELEASFFVPYRAFGATSVAQHSISLFVSDAIDRWKVPDDETAIGGSDNDDLGGLKDDIEGNVIELRWVVVFKDGCCPVDLQEEPTNPCEQ